MKISGRHTPFLLFLLSTLTTSSAIDGPLSRDVSPNQSIHHARSVKDILPGQVGTAGKPAPIGTEHAPVDGKDGMPHDGPFVETGAERSRKKQLSDDDEPIVEKPIKKEQYSNADIPQSNDAVMDDRRSSKPAEGTRGTEGGISGKGKTGILTDKKPDAPKDARPHTEDQKDPKALVSEDSKTTLKVNNRLLLLCKRYLTIFPDSC